MKHLERALDGQNQVWKYIVMFIVAFFGGQIIGGLPLAAIILIKTFTSGAVKPENHMDFSAYGISSNMGLALMLLSFVASFILFAVLIKPLHKRTVLETINGRNKIRKNRILMGILVWGVIMLVGLIISVLTAEPGEVEVQFNWRTFIPLLIIVLIFIPFQTTIEEILFRGYLSQGIAAHTKSRWIALITTSLFFGLMHSFNPEVKEFGFWLAMPPYVIMGLMLGLISILDDGLEIAIGIHFINNAFGALFTTHSASALQTDAAFKFNDVDPGSEIISTLITAIVVIFVLAKIYKWDFRIMNKKVEATPPPVPVAMEAEGF